MKAIISILVSVITLHSVEGGDYISFWDTRESLRRGDAVAEVRRFIRHHHVNEVDYQGDTMLMHAAMYGRPRAAQILLWDGANVNKQDENAGWSPLHGAAFRGKLVMVNRLLDAGADINLQTNLGQTPLHLAAYEGNLEVVKKLLQAGANDILQDNDGYTAYDNAYGRDRVHIKQLIKMNALSQGASYYCNFYC